MVNELGVCTLMPAHMVLNNWNNLPPETQQRIRLVDEPKCYRTICLSGRRQSQDAALEKSGFSDFAEYARYFIQSIDRDVSNLLRDRQP